jgi:thiol-disulfide isomerase/thioredoxin
MKLDAPHQVRKYLPGVAYLLVPALLIALPTLILLHNARTPSLNQAPDWVLNNINGGGTGKLSSFNGKVRLLNFWASWCGSCREEMPDLVTMTSHYQGKSFTVLSINYGENSATAKQFAVSYGADFPIFLDPNRQVSTKYGVFTIPTSVLVAPNGKIDRVWVGQIIPSNVQKDIDALLK